MSGPRVMVAWRWWYHRCEGMQSGQMTVELAVLVPVVIVVALIVANLMEFVDACAAFDRLSLDEVIAEGSLPQASRAWQHPSLRSRMLFAWRLAVRVRAMSR